MSDEDKTSTGAVPDPVPELPEPTLDDAAISPEAAHNASLEEAEAEAARVEIEAKSALSEPAKDSWLNNGNDSDTWDNAFGAIENPEKTTTEAEAELEPEAESNNSTPTEPAAPEPPQKSAPAPEPASVSEPASEPAAPQTENLGPVAQPGAIPAAGTPLAPPAGNSPAGNQPAGNPPPGIPPNGWAQQPGGSGEPSEPANNPGKKSSKLWIFISGAVLVLALIAFLVWLLMNLLNGPTDNSSNTDSASASSNAATPRPSSSDGLIQSNANPSSWAVGDCLRGYADINTAADVVSCSTGHSAQLIGTFDYPNSDSFPGEETLKTKGDEYCAGIELVGSAANYDIRQQFGYPTESTWQKGDRRIDCVAYTKGGEIIKENLVK